MAGITKVIRDPVHNMIGFEDTPTDRLLIDLINCKEFQRLRRIKQLGFSEITFPGANHSRLAHSIGVMHTARIFLGRLKVHLGEKLTTEQQQIVLVAALLHDVGHGPFSHAFEKVTKDSHESRTREIILHENTEVNQTLRKISKGLPQQVAAFFNEDPDALDVGMPPCFTHVVTSQLDADRSDYLLRDSYATGTDYGRFDLNWLVDHLMVDVQQRWLYLNRKAFYACEQYVFARYHMYQAVYFHKATRAAEVMLRLLFQRYREQLAEVDSQEKREKVVLGAPPAVVGAFSGKLDLEHYLDLDDSTVTEFFKRCEKCQDQVLSRLAAGILHRRLFKSVDLTSFPRERLPDFSDAARQRVQQAGFEVKYFFAPDTPADTPYKIFDPTDEQPATQIFVENESGKVVPLNQASEQVEALRKRITLLRYYFPLEIRDQIVELTN